jgi:hypothetical protein
MIELESHHTAVTIYTTTKKVSEESVRHIKRAKGLTLGRGETNILK